MPVFDIPVRFEVEMDCPILAPTQHEAVMKAMSLFELPRGADLAKARVVGICGTLSDETFERFTSPPPPDPMEAWTCNRKSGPYEGGYWSMKTEDGYEMAVIGIDSPIDVGMGWTTYTWSIKHDRLTFDVDSKERYDDKVVCRDAVLEMLEKVRKL